MATGNIVRTDDGSGPNIATVTGSEDAITKHWQGCVIVDNTDPVANKLAIDSSGHAQVDIAASSVTVAVSNTVLSVVGGGVEATAQRVTIASDSTGVLSVDDNGGSLTVDNAQLSVVGSGTEAAAMRVTIATDSTGVLSVDDNGSSLTVDGTVTASNCTGNVAHSSADSGNPIKVGMKAIAHGANPTAVDADERTDWYANRHGIPFVCGPHMNVQTIEFTQADADGAQTDIALITVGAGTKIAVTQIQVLVDQANTVETSVRVGFAAATLSAASTTPVAGMVLSHPGIVPGAGVSRGDGMGIIGIGTDGQDLRITMSDPVGGNNVVLISYFTIES